MIEVFVFSGWSRWLRKSLRKKDILVRYKNALDAVSPLAVVGKRSENFLRENINKCGDRQVHSVISLKKNFANMISRDTSDFESNFKVCPLGENVDSCNSTEYLIISFSELSRPLYKVDEGIYSFLNDKELFDEISKHEKIPFPFPKNFDWKYYIELLSEACMKNYDNSHIILIRTSPSEIVTDNKNINDKGSSRELRNFIKEAEDYFIEKTHCHCIEELLGQYSSRGRFWRSEYAYDCIAEEIRKIVDGDEVFCKSYIYRSNIIRRLYLRLNKDVFKKIEQKLMEKDLLTDVEFEKMLFEYTGDDAIIKNLYDMKFFLQKEWYTLTDYLREKANGFDLNKINLYTKYFKLNMDDVLSVVNIYFKAKNKGDFCECIKNMCSNTDCYPIESMRKYINRNIEYLLEYKFIDDELKKILNINMFDVLDVYPLRVTAENVILLQPKASDAEDFISFDVYKEVMPDIDSIVNNGMICHDKELNFLSQSWSFYLKKAQYKKGNMPLICEFHSDKEFQQSLIFIDYPSILESENVILLKSNNGYMKKKIWGDKCNSKCNLTPILEENVKVFFIGSGLGDQIRMYVYSKYIETFSGAKVLYDDVRIEHEQIFNGLDIKHFIKDQEFENKLLSNILSKKLKEQYVSKNMLLCDLLCQEGYNNCLAVTENWLYRAGVIKKCDVLISKMNMMGIKLAANTCFKYYRVISSPEVYMRKGDAITKFLRLPDFCDEKNKELETTMLACDAVVLHIRCGDALQDSFRIPDTNFFCRCLEKLNTIKEYNNKKYFIVSDNMKYVRERKKEFGLDSVDEEDIYYIEHNSGKHSYLDMKIIALGKIIIASYSGFSRMAALLSLRKEIYLCQAKEINERFRRMGWKNKYEFEI